MPVFVYRTRLASCPALATMRVQLACLFFVETEHCSIPCILYGSSKVGGVLSCAAAASAAAAAAAAASQRCSCNTSDARDSSLPGFYAA